MPRSFLENVGGLYNPTLRFAFTNITTQDFVSHWAKVPIIVKPGETIEISNTTPIPGAGHALAVKMTMEMVDNIMIGEAKLDEIRVNQAYYRSPKGSSLGVPAARKPYEDQILRELAPDEESPATQMMRQKLRDEILGSTDEKSQPEPIKVPTKLEEFAELNAKPVPEAPQQPAQTVGVTETPKKRGGRPKKVVIPATNEASVTTN